MYNELLKAGLTYEVLQKLSYHTQLEKSLVHKVGLKLRNLYENGKILSENMFQEVLKNVLSDC